MFFVFNKDKIMAFVVTCATVFALFLMSSLFAKVPTQTIETSSSQTHAANSSIQTEGNNTISDNNIENNEIQAK